MKMYIIFNDICRRIVYLLFEINYKWNIARHIHVCFEMKTKNYVCSAGIIDLLMQCNELQ